MEKAGNTRDKMKTFGSYWCFFLLNLAVAKVPLKSTLGKVEEIHSRRVPAPETTV